MERYNSAKERQLYTEEANRIERLVDSSYLQELTEYKQWTCFKVEHLNGRRTKPPINPKTGIYASPTDASTWGSYKEALNALQSGKYQGIGFVTTANDPFIFVDIDQVVQGNRSISYQGQRAMELLETAWQYSPGDGLHGIGRGDIGGINRKIGNFEVYSRDRYMTLTFLPVPDSLVAIEDISESLTAIFGGLAKKEDHLPGYQKRAPCGFWD